MYRRLHASQEAVRTEIDARISALEQLRHTERLATIDRLSSGIAHELGTPLNFISGRAKLIETEDLEKKEIAKNDCKGLFLEAEGGTLFLDEIGDIPMAISLAFGVLFATGITLLLIPCGYVIMDDIHNLLI